jgi:hypothetical protein
VQLKGKLKEMWNQMKGSELWFKFSQTILHLSTHLSVSTKFIREDANVFPDLKEET